MTATPEHIDMSKFAAPVATHITVSVEQWHAHELAGYKRGLEAAAKVFEPAETSEHRYYAMHIRSLGEQK